MTDWRVTWEFNDLKVSKRDFLSWLKRGLYDGLTKQSIWRVMYCCDNESDIQQYKKLQKFSEKRRHMYVTIANRISLRCQSCTGERQTTFSKQCDACMYAYAVRTRYYRRIKTATEKIEYARCNKLIKDAQNAWNAQVRLWYNELTILSEKDEETMTSFQRVTGKRKDMVRYYDGTYLTMGAVEPSAKRRRTDSHQLPKLTPAEETEVENFMVSFPPFSGVAFKFAFESLDDKLFGQ